VSFRKGLSLKFGLDCRPLAQDGDIRVRGVGWCYEHRRMCGNLGPPVKEA